MTRTVFVLALTILAPISFAFAQMPAEPLRPDNPVTELDPVQIRSQLDKQGGPLITAPGSFGHKTQNEIHERSSSNLSHILDFEPNVEFVGGPRAGAELPQIRGLNSNRILILDEGVRQNFQSGHNGRIFADFSLMEEIEVVKGPWSSLYGSGAMGGVISFRRSTASDLIRRTGLTTGAEITLDGATANNQTGGRVTGFSKVGIFEPLISARVSNSSDVRLGTGDELPYSASKDQDLYASLGLRFSENHHFHLKIGARDERADSLINPNDNLGAQNPAADLRSRKYDYVGDYQFKNERVDFHAKPYVRRTEVEKIRVSDKRTDTQIVDTTGIDLWNNLPLTFSDSVRSVLTLGAETFTDKNTGTRGTGPLAAFPDGRTQQTGVYVQPSIIMNDTLTITPGLRWDSYKTEDLGGTAKDTSGERTSAKFYVSKEYKPKHLIFAGWGQAFNAPRLQDLYVSGVHFPGNFFVPNPDLKPENAETFEVGFKNQTALSDETALQWSGTYFVTEARDFIQQNVLATTTNFINVDEVRLEGAELSSFYQHTLWGAGLSYGLVRSKDKASGDPLPDTAADQFNLRGEYYASDALTFGTDAKWAQKQTRVPSGVSETPEFYSQDVYASWKEGNFKAVLRVNNVFDRNYRRHGSAIADVGRDVRATASFAF
ncbi:MAG: TonB-dependent receptor [Bdellovibrionaceae bacterium]|nr:TonB-dependent receptor [Pseudobdellovibrionaceae bacterium]